MRGFAGGEGFRATRFDSESFLIIDATPERSTVKASYARNARGASWGAHGTYLAREGAQREGAMARGFDAEHDDVDLTATLQQWQQAGDRRLWKFIVSPEHGARLDLPAHTRALVARMERDLGTHLEWAAIDHHNTDNAHVHLLVRGRDTGGADPGDRADLPQDRASHAQPGAGDARARLTDRAGAPGRTRPDGRADTVHGDRSRGAPAGRSPRPGDL